MINKIKEFFKLPYKKITFFGLGLAATFWTLDSIADFLMVHGNRFADQILGKTDHIWTRLLMSLLIAAFGVYVQLIIAKLKRTEEKVTDAKKEWERTFDAVPDLIAIIDKNYRIKQINRALAERVRISPEKAQGMACYQVIHGKDKPLPLCPHAMLLKKPGEYMTEIHEELLKGDFIVSTSPLYEADGKLEGAVHVARDITERKRFEEALRESEKRFKDIAESVSDWIWEIDPEGICIYCSEKVQDTLGYKSEEIIGKSLFDFIAHSEQKEARAVFRELMSKKLPISQLENWYTTKDGGLVCLSVNGIPVMDEKGKLICYRGASSNITERKKAEEALRESEEKYRTLVESSSDAILMMDEDRNIISCNRAFLELFGYEKQEVEGKSIKIIHPSEESFRSFGDAVYSVIDKTGSFRTEWEFRRKDGTLFHVETVTSVIKSSKNTVKGYVAIIRDITERKQAEEEKRKLQAQLFQSEKMASIGQLAAGIAHEINNPTGFVSSNLRSLADYQEDINKLISHYRTLVSNLKNVSTSEGDLSFISKEIDRIIKLEEEVDIDFILNDIPNLIKECQDGANRIKKIVLDLKNFAHPGEDKLKLADINQNIDSTLNVVWNEIKYKATVVKDYGELPRVPCYPQQLNQVFMNLLVNAAQAIEKEGQIKIVTRSNNNHVEIKISDTGVGIPKEHIPRIFDPFFTTKEVGKGTGLGLNVVYNIVKKHNGTIDVESEVGKGTTFTVRIPINQDYKAHD